MSRTSALQYRRGEPRNLREIGWQLGVAFVVEGAVRRVGSQVRVSAQLIDARTDLHRWAETYEQPLKDIFALQSEIAQSIAEQLHANIAPVEKTEIEEAPTHDLIAFDAFLGNKEEAIKEGRRAVQLLPVALDPIDGPKMIEFLAVTYAWVGEPFSGLRSTRHRHQAPRNLDLRYVAP